MKPINSYDKKYLEHNFNEMLFWMDSLRYDSKKLDLVNIREHITESYDKYLGIFKVLCPPEKKPSPEKVCRYLLTSGLCLLKPSLCDECGLFGEESQ